MLLYRHFMATAFQKHFMVSCLASRLNHEVKRMQIQKKKKKNRKSERERERERENVDPYFI